MDLLIEIESTLKAEINKTILLISSNKSMEIPEINIETPKSKEHGDFATNIAMQLARHLKKSPKVIAEQIIDELNKEEAGVEKAEIAGPGFINFFMKKNFLNGIVDIILKEKDAYGTSNYGENRRQQVEFVSVNPTGDLHL